MAAIKAVLSEWYRTFETLPLILRQAVQMGLFSSQQLVRFCAMDNRPTVTRAVQRSLPTSVRLPFLCCRFCAADNQVHFSSGIISTRSFRPFSLSLCTFAQLCFTDVSKLVALQVARGLVGRMMADPAFVQKLLMESVICTSSSLLWEAQQRGERFSKELDLVAINTLSLLAANAALVWCVVVSDTAAVLIMAQHVVASRSLACCVSGLLRHIAL